MAEAGVFGRVVEAEKVLRAAKHELCRALEEWELLRMAAQDAIGFRV